ncbi:MAG: hypothetical protein A2Y57_02220 [Candidatus Woykebacteria bacterium RBG_13_40_7b]|uniref:Uncharacterized protein n=1 Tax=Candidatus Woykebacteria bacterium RBG_13_40_7b TaxID=1802594 RepID=A0A1G1W8N0_9BACT|nr:MAG: hypothetical protein A2Y57_02220 [Candidatus Woykebacteria bacterium RBG_13_40_7b]
MPNKNHGQLLIELIIAFAVLSLILVAIVGGFISTREGRFSSSQAILAEGLLQEQIEALRSIKERGWNEVSINDIYHAEIDQNWQWVLKPGELDKGGFKTKITIDDSCRSDLTTIVDCPSGTKDPLTKKVSALVSWGSSSNDTVEKVIYLTRYLKNDRWIQTTQAEFDLGTKTNVETASSSGGEVVLSKILAAPQTSGNQFTNTSLGNIGNFGRSNYWPSIRFTAQSTKNLRQVSFYQASRTGTGTFRVEVRANGPNNTPGSVLTYANYSISGNARWIELNLTTQINITQGQIYHITIRRTSGTGTLNIRYTNPLNHLIPYDNAPDAYSNLLFTLDSGASWLTLNYQPVYFLRFTDSTYEGNPLHLFSTSYVYGTNFVGEQFLVTGEDKKILSASFYASQRSTSEPQNNLFVTLYDVTNRSVLESGILATPSQVTINYSWFTYTFTTQPTLRAGNNYILYLSSPSTTSARAYTQTVQSTQNSQNYIGRTFDGANSIYAASSNGGTVWNTVNYSDIPFRYTTQSLGNYATSGTFESQSLSSTASLGFNYTSWLGQTPAGTAIRFQTAANKDNLTWNFVGPDGTTGTFYNQASAIHFKSAEGQFFRFKAFLSSDGTATPILEEAGVNWSP